MAAELGVVVNAAVSVRNAGHELAHGGGVTAQLAGDDRTRHTLQGFQQLAKEPLGGFGSAPALDEDVEHMTVLVDRAPWAMRKPPLGPDKVGMPAKLPWPDRTQQPGQRRLDGTSALIGGLISEPTPCDPASEVSAANRPAPQREQRRVVACVLFEEKGIVHHRASRNAVRLPLRRQRGVERYWTVCQPLVTSCMKARTVALMNSTSDGLKPGEAATWPCTLGIVTCRPSGMAAAASLPASTGL